MTATLVPDRMIQVGPLHQQLDQLLDNFDRRLFDLEQLATSPGFADTPIPDELEVDKIIISPLEDPTKEYVLDWTSNPPTGLVLTTGTFYDRVYIDAEWQVSDTAAAYMVEWAVKNVALGTYDFPSSMTVLGNHAHIEGGLIPNTTYGVRVTAQNRIGLPSTRLPAAGYMDIVTGIDATIPEAPTGLTVASILNGFVVVWDESPDSDVGLSRGLFEIQVATDSGFNAIAKAVRVAGMIGSVDGLSPDTNYWIRVAAIDASGNQSDWTLDAGSPRQTAKITTVEITDNAISAPKIAANTISSTHIITAGLDAAVIKFGEMSGARITTGTLSADKIATGTLSVSTSINVAGEIKVGDTTNGVYLNSSGLTGYAAGAQIFRLDVVSGTAFFGGSLASGVSISSPVISGGTITGMTVRTGPIGSRRVEMSSTFAPYVYFYSSTESSPARIGTDTYLAADSTFRDQLTIESADFGYGRNSIKLRSGAPTEAPYVQINSAGLMDLNSGPAGFRMTGGRLELAYHLLVNNANAADEPFRVYAPGQASSWRFLKTGDGHLAIAAGQNILLKFLIGGTARLDVRTGNDGDFAPFKASTLEASGAITAGGGATINGQLNVSNINITGQTEVNFSKPIAATYFTTSGTVYCYNVSATNNVSAATVSATSSMSNSGSYYTNGYFVCNFQSGRLSWPSYSSAISGTGATGGGIDVFGVRGYGEVYAYAYYQNGGGWNTFSDINLKQNVVRSQRPVLADVVNTPVYEFEYKSDPSRKVIGFVAQESPGYLVRNVKRYDHLAEKETETLAISLGEQVAVLWKAVQELAAEVELLKKRPPVAA